MNIKKYKQYINITNIIIVINVILFILTYLLTSLPVSQFLLEKGGIYMPDIVDKHRYYQLITHMFLHANTSHLIGNMISLYLIGNEIEKNIGKILYSIVYFGTGIFAAIFSGYVEAEFFSPSISVGASGAIFGLMGFLAVMKVIDHKKSDKAPQRLLAGIVILMAVYSMEPGVNWLAHLGGAIAGIILALLLYFPKKEK